MTQLQILIPAYNTAPYLDECIRSIAAQAGSNVRVLVLNDGSTDDTAARLRVLALEFDWLKIINHESNLGIAAVRNRLLAEATGDYLWQVDSDDTLTPGTIARLLRIMADHQPDLITGDFQVQYANPSLKQRIRQKRHRSTFAGPSNRLSQRPEEWIPPLYARGCMHSWCKVAKRECWRDVRYPEGGSFEDIVGMAQLQRNVRTHWHDPHIWIRYRQRADSLLRSISKRDCEQWIQAAVVTKQLLPSFAPGLAMPIDYFMAKNLASALRSSGQDPDIRNLVRKELPRILPHGLPDLMHRLWRRGWWARALRLHARLKN